MAYMLRDLSPEKKQRVIMLAQIAFKDAPCGECKGACCRDCGATGGYIRRKIPREEWEQISKDYNFDGEVENGDGTYHYGKGFLTDKGCSLPMELRSVICIGFSCFGPPKNLKWPNPAMTLYTSSLISTEFSEGNKPIRKVE